HTGGTDMTGVQKLVATVGPIIAYTTHGIFDMNGVGGVERLSGDALDERTRAAIGYQHGRAELLANMASSGRLFETIFNVEMLFLPLGEGAGLLEGEGASLLPKANCFTAGTLVQAAEGQKPIEDIRIGDFVWAENVQTG